MSETEVNSAQYVTFILGGELFGVEVSRTREILSLVPVTAVPRTPEYMRGVINLRGQVVPVIDMRTKLGMPAGAVTQDTCIVVIEIKVNEETLIVGAQADAVREVIEVNSDQVEPPPRLGAKLNTEYIHGMGKLADHFIILLDIDRVFSSNELALVQDISEASLPEEQREEQAEGQDQP